MQKLSRTTEDTEKIAKDFLKTCVNNTNKNSCVVCLHGDLGAGKTTFSKFLAKELGVKRKVNSPTFVIMKRYEIKSKNNKFKNLYHLDAYRLKNEKELDVLGWKNIVADPNNLILIEWPENVKKAIPKKHHKIEILHTKEGHRKFKIKKK
ncbi:MAG TPA: tRNA (adenosine(37)-N6)-threonylcarbamoyltransferase complex ATPase subunit type 1 TsaE [Candidatus Paceibacterota bacterium]|nr:tRNA (adenosine(37)-N6)-threonylcarbamoyltransferase complex ATPase subunit type 1 TsaE [Candidatus Paceibacterota bacterium]